MKRYVLVLLLSVLFGCDVEAPSFSVIPEADGKAFANGQEFPESFILTLAVDVTDASPTTVAATLDGQQLNLAKGVLIEKPGLHEVLVDATDSRGNRSYEVLQFTLLEPGAPHWEKVEFTAWALENHIEVGVVISGFEDAEPTHWTIAGHRPDGNLTQVFTLPSYRLVEGRPRLGDPSEAVFADGEWHLRFKLPKGEVPEIPVKFFVMGSVDGEPIVSADKAPEILQSVGRYSDET